MAPDQSPDANRYRIARLEQDVHDLQVDVRSSARREALEEIQRELRGHDLGALKQTVADLVADNREVRGELSSLRRALYTAALSVSGAALLFAATFFASQ
jgi:hypothetical protein